MHLTSVLAHAVLSCQRKAASIIQGDFHASAAGSIRRSGELTLKNKVHVVLTGTLGTGDLPFPSSFRSVESKPSQLEGMEEVMKPTEENGFSIIDVTPEKDVQYVSVATSATDFRHRHDETSALRCGASNVRREGEPL
jgi:hypothetical protein